MIAPVRFGILVVEVAVPVNDAVIVPALKLPEASLATMVLLVLLLVALEVTVNEDAPELLNVVDPDNPVPEVARVNVFAKFPLNVEAVIIPEELILVALAAPNTGVTRVGLVANTATPVPVSSVSAVARLAELKEPNDVVVLLDVIAPVKLGILVVEVAVPVTVPVIAPTNDVAVITPLKLAPLPKSDVVCVVIPLKVESPLIFSEVKSLGAAATADSIVAVVVASRETIF